MSWSFKWSGRAVDYIPDNAKFAGESSGPMAQAARDTVYEMLQALGNADTQRFVEVKANGWEEESWQADHGSLTVTVTVVDEPSELKKRVEGQQPVDLLRTDG